LQTGGAGRKSRKRPTPVVGQTPNAESQVKLYSYIVDHDTGFAPNPFGGICTLVCCKFSHPPKRGKARRRNIVELACPGDWIVGLGGKNEEKSSGPGKIIYAMLVTKKMPLDEYCKLSTFRNRTCTDAKRSPKQDWRQALISKEFYYFGRNAKDLPPSLFSELRVGRNFKNHFSGEFIKKFKAWIHKQRRGKSGKPCWQRAASGAYHSGCSKNHQRKM
jgi:hypothetical protein